MESQQLTRTEYWIVRILQRHIGPVNAVTAEVIGHEVGKSAREVRRIITKLTVMCGYGEICATQGEEAFGGKGRGYFWASNADQVETYYNVLVSRQSDIKKRMDAAWQAKKRMEGKCTVQSNLGI